MKYKDYFSKNYYQARDKFKKASLKNNFVLEKKIVTEDLTIDYSFFETKEKNKLVILLSGTHGVEGYTGSAVQLYFLDKVFPSLKNKYSIALIHSLNPYGMKYLRRYNHNNVDLNRNYIKDFEQLKEDKETIKDINKYRNVMSPQREAKPYFIEQILHYYYILNTYLHIGMRRLVKASSKGQNLFPNTVAYCGNKREIENLYLEEIIKKITKDYKEVIFIDIHTGTAKRGRLNIFTQDVNFRKKLKKISRYVYIKKIKSKRGMNYIGGNDKLFLENTNGLKNAEMTLEFGPFSRINSLFSIEHTSFLISYENMITFFGPKEKLEKARIRLKNVFSPERKTYKKFVIQKSSNFFKNLFRNF